MQGTGLIRLLIFQLLCPFSKSLEISWKGGRQDQQSKSLCQTSRFLFFVGRWDCILMVFINIVSGEVSRRETERDQSNNWVCSNLHLICFSSCSLAATFIFLAAPSLSERTWAGPHRQVARQHGDENTRPLVLLCSGLSFPVIFLMAHLFFPPPMSFPSHFFSLLCVYVTAQWRFRRPGDVRCF